jgi:serine protease Do
MRPHQFPNHSLSLLLSAATLSACLPTPIAAQEATAVSAAAAPQSDRDTEYAALARDVDALDRELSIIKRVVKLVTPAVVHIEAALLPRYRGMLNIEEAGSGVIVQFGSDHYVLTNRHVIRHSSQELIRILVPDGRTLRPTRIWTDQETDVAVMAITETDLPAARLGNSDVLEIGDYVLAIGSPFGLSQSVTRGIVSAKGRHNLDLGDGGLRWQNFIQTDAAINPGNSGGPLVNLRGEIVGLNTAIASSSGGNEGIGFSIPINIVGRIARQLVETNAVARGYLGVKFDDRFDERRARDLGLVQLTGTRIDTVYANTPAEQAGIQADDVILEFNGVRVESYTHLQSLVKLTEVGKSVPLVVYRGGRLVRKSVLIADMSDFGDK